METDDSFSYKAIFYVWSFMVFSFDAFAAKEKNLFFILFLMIGSMILANLFLASRVPRVVFVVYPAIGILSAIGINHVLKRNAPFAQ